MTVRKWGDGMAPMGRPKSDNPKATQLTVRVDRETLERLDICADAFKETRAQVIRRGIDKLFSEIKK